MLSVLLYLHMGLLHVEGLAAASQEPEAPPAASPPGQRQREKGLFSVCKTKIDRDLGTSTFIEFQEYP